MKKIYNLFSWVAVINLMVTMAPFNAVLASGTTDGTGGLAEMSVVAEAPDDTDDVGVENETEVPILYIRSVNPGYKVDGVNNVGEMIEIGKNSDDLVWLAGVTVRYTNSSGNETVLVEFPENSYLAGETLLLRLDDSPSSELSNVTYETTLALKAGPLALFVGDELIDSVCWTGKNGCMKEFVSARPTTLKRNLVIGEFEHAEGYEPDFDEDSYLVGDLTHDTGAGGGEENLSSDDEEGDVDDEGGNGGGGSDSGDTDSGDDSDDENGSEGDGLGDDESSNEGGEDDENETEILDGEKENLNEKPGEHDKNDDSTGVEDSENENKVEKEIEEDDGLNAPTEEATEFGNGTLEGIRKCVGLEFSEIFSYYNEAQTEQFIELHNVGLATVQTEECLIRYKSKTYRLSGEVEPNGYMVRWANDFKLTKNPTSSNVIELLSEDGEVVDVVEYYNGQKQGAAWAMVGREVEEEVWRITYAVTPGKPNVEAGKGAVSTKTCVEGQYLNPLTGRCKKIEDEADEKQCAEGYYLNEETGRCRKIVVETAKTCKEGYYLNEETGRCRKIVTETEKVCAEGYYLNEETGRCRKIVENDGAEYELVREDYEEESSFVALYAVLIVVGLGLLYVIYEFRKEIGKFFKRLLKK